MTATVVDGATDVNAMTCNANCLTESWWLGRSSDCAVVCMGNQTWTECMHSDCEVIEATRYAVGVRTSLAPMLLSSEARSFYLIGSPATQSYTTDASCTLQIGNATPEHLACLGAQLQLPTAVLDAATGEQAAVLDGAASPGRYSY